MGAAVLLVTLAASAGFALLKHRAGPSKAIGPTVAPGDREAELRRLAAWGLQVPDGGAVLEHPFEPPWSSRSLVVPRAWYPQGAVERLLGYDLKVRPGDLLADLDILQPVMERAYGGWDSAKKRGWDWDRWFAGWRASLRRAGQRELSLDEAFAPFDQLIAFQRDNHSQIPLQRFETASASETYLLASRATGPCRELLPVSGKPLPIDPDDAGQRVREALALSDRGDALLPVQYIARPVSEGPFKAVRCGDESIPLEASERSRRTLGRMVWNALARGKADGPELRRVSDEIVYARIPTMEPALYVDLEKRRMGWPTPTGRERLLIVDLRENGGGDTHFGYAVLKGWLDPKRTVPVDQLGMKVVSSCLYAPLKWGFYGELERGMKAPLPEQERESLQGALDALFRPARPGCPREVSETRAQWTYGQHRVQRAVPGMRLVVWTSSGCGSDCELLTAELASLPESVVVGANTLGLGQFTQPGYGMLPHVRLPYRIALGQSNLYGDDRSFDGYGIDVDVVLRKGDWTVERVAKIADLLR